MPGRMGDGGSNDRMAAWYDAHPDQAINPAARPGYVWGTLDPRDNSGLHNSWVSGADWQAAHPTGWTLAQLLAVAAPFALGGASALGAFGGGAAAGAAPAAAGGAGSAATTAAGAGTAAAHAAGGAGMAGFGVPDALQYGPLIASLFMGHGNNTVPYADQLNSLLGEQRSRMQAADPLYQAILRMAMGMVPTAYRGQ